jgi:hypothetical protein
MQLLGLMERQAATLECINIGDNPGRINLERFQVSMSRFAKIRRLDLSRITRTSGEEPLIVPEVMLSWRLEELVLNGIPVSVAEEILCRADDARSMIKPSTPFQHISLVKCLIAFVSSRWNSAT